LIVYTYYIDAVDGNDINPGTSAAPWKTMTKAFTMAGYGDTVIVRDGNYGEIDNPINFPVHTGDINEPLPPGTPFITIKADAGHEPVFSRIKLGYAYDSSYYTPYVFDGIKVGESRQGIDLRNCVGIRLKNSTITGSSVGSGVGIEIKEEYKSNDIQILNCDISTFLQAIKPKCNNLVIKGNKVHNIGEDYLQMSSGANVLIEGNYLYEPNKVEGAHMDYLALGGQITNLIVRSNYFQGSQSQSIFCHGQTDPNEPPKEWNDVIIENNLICNNKSYEVQIQNMHNLIYRNNTVIGNGGVISTGLRIEPTCSNVSAYNNIFITKYYGNGDGYPDSFADHDNNIYIAGSIVGANEPNSYAYDSMEIALAELFVDSNNGDFCLKEGARAIDFGTSLWAVPATDILGNPRDIQPDAGCHEFNPGAPVFDPIERKTVGANETLTFEVQASDPEQDPIEYWAEMLPSDATFIDQIFTWTPIHSQAGEYYVMFMAGDGQFRSSQTIAITVGYPPILGTLEEKTVFENELLNFSVDANDIDSNVLTYHADNLPDGATFEAKTGEFNWTPVTGQAGFYSVTFTVSDGYYSDSNTAHINVHFVDTDSDGMADWWELQYFANLSAGPRENPDGDELTNLMEFKKRTNPNVFDENPDLLLDMRLNDDPNDGVTDSSSYGNDGITYGDVRLTFGRTGDVNEAYDFDGSGDFVYIPHAPHLDVDNISVAAWIYRRDLGNGRIVCKSLSTIPEDYVFSLGVDDAGSDLSEVKVRLATETGVVSVYGTIFFEKFTWTHVAFTYDGRKISIYVNGVEGGVFNKTGNMQKAAIPVVIGNVNLTNDRYFNGRIEDVTIFDRALDPNEVSELFTGAPPEPNQLITDAQVFAESQLADTVADINTDAYPMYTLSYASWYTTSASRWTSGFFPGCLWRMYELNSNANYLGWAQDWTAGLAGEATTNPTQDLVFIIYNTFGTAYRLTANETYKTIVIQAAETVANQRYNPAIGAIVAGWGQWVNSVNIDSMMTVELLFWASKNGGRSAWYDMALSHAYRVMKDHVRPNGSISQYANYDGDTGDFIDNDTLQGYSTDSTWSRGQAWAVYGFTVTYRETSDVNFLNTAVSAADYFVD
ncbi:MAG: LamG-like jellyroll fold domain-containing protein, partial [Planctomycetota bacterium]